MIREMISKGSTGDIVEFWKLNFAKGRPDDQAHWELFEEISSGIFIIDKESMKSRRGVGKFKQRFLSRICRSGPKK